MSNKKLAIDMTPKELEQWIDSLETEDDDIPEYHFSNPDPYFKITPSAEPKNKNFWFGEDGHIHVKKYLRLLDSRTDPDGRNRRHNLHRHRKLRRRRILFTKVGTYHR